MSERCLFVIRDLPRPVISAARVVSGEEALSGTHTSGLLVAEGLARRGHEIGVCIVHGQRVVDTRVRCFDALDEAVNWVGKGRVIWLSYGDESIMCRLNSLSVKPIVWTQLPVSWVDRDCLESGRARGIVVVSDTMRMPLLRSGRHRRASRIYNPLAPLFAASPDAPKDRFARRVVVYAGAAGITKGLHRLLEMWRYARRRDPSITLRLAGTGRLYGSERELGQFGIASPDFEARYVAPLASEFGSLAAAGVEPVGLLSPRELRTLYTGASLGVVNLNWGEYTETFCCAGTEMLATGLPVFSVARGALPETLGYSGGAVLTRREALETVAREFGELVADSTRLARLGGAGQAYVCEVYGLEHIVSEWERLLLHGEDIEALCGPWRGPRSSRYFLEIAAGHLGVPWLLDGAAATRRVMKRSLAKGPRV